MDLTRDNLASVLRARFGLDLRRSYGGVAVCADRTLPLADARDLAIQTLNGYTACRLNKRTMREWLDHAATTADRIGYMLNQVTARPVTRDSLLSLAVSARERPPVFTPDPAPRVLSDAPHLVRERERRAEKAAARRAAEMLVPPPPKVSTVPKCLYCSAKPARRRSAFCSSYHQHNYAELIVKSYEMRWCVPCAVWVVTKPGAGGTPTDHCPSCGASLRPCPY
jgi:hypothetical protein